MRQGSETKESSEEQFDELVAQHNSKAAVILKWKGEAVTVVTRQQFPTYVSEGSWNETTRVVFCNQFYVTIQINAERPQSFPLSRVEINFDNSRRRLQLLVML